MSILADIYVSQFVLSSNFYLLMASRYHPMYKYYTGLQFASVTDFFTYTSSRPVPRIGPRGGGSRAVNLDRC